MLRNLVVMQLSSHAQKKTLQLTTTILQLMGCFTYIDLVLHCPQLYAHSISLRKTTDVQIVGCIFLHQKKMLPCSIHCTLLPEKKARVPLVVDDAAKLTVARMTRRSRRRAHESRFRRFFSSQSRRSPPRRTSRVSLRRVSP